MVWFKFRSILGIYSLQIEKQNTPNDWEVYGGGILGIFDFLFNTFMYFSHIVQWTGMTFIVQVKDNSILKEHEI